MADRAAVYRVLGLPSPEHRQEGAVMAPARPAAAASPAPGPALATPHEDSS